MQARDGVVAARAAIVLRRGFVGKLTLGQLAVGGDHHHVVGQEDRRDSDSGIEQAAWVVAKVEHQAAHLGVLFV